MLEEINLMNQTVFSLSGFDINVLQLMLCGLVAAAAIYVYIKFQRFDFFDSNDNQASKPSYLGFRLKLVSALIFMSFLIILRIINYDVILIDFNGISITLNQIVEILSLFSVAILFDWIISHVVIKNRFLQREIPVRTSFNKENTNETKATNLVRYIVYLYVAQILIKRMDIDAIIMQRMIKGELLSILVSDMLIAVLIIMLARVVIWFITHISLYRMYRNNDMDEGIQFAINQLVSYIIYVFAFIFALDRLVSDMSIIYGGAAALLVGVGLGLQQTFNDFFSGLVLLFERSVMIGDILEIDGQVGRLLKIGLRASKIETRHSVSMLVPNSKLVNQSVVNWTHSDNMVRFEVKVLIEYGADTNLVKELLIKSLEKNDSVKIKPAPFVRLNDFADNGLSLSLYFFSSQVMWAEEIRSNVRFEIDRLFRENSITIPFPQRDIRVIYTSSKPNE
ncbi:MAG: mechanosensitive ion channel [Saprospiraceae bacterium]|nr:mechanosensitive ion channel [Saprospiraceae bacterium]